MDEGTAAAEKASSVGRGQGTLWRWQWDETSWEVAEGGSCPAGMVAACSWNPMSWPSAGATPNRPASEQDRRVPCLFAFFCWSSRWHAGEILAAASAMTLTVAAMTATTATTASEMTQATPGTQKADTHRRRSYNSQERALCRAWSAVSAVSARSARSAAMCRARDGGRFLTPGAADLPTAWAASVFRRGPRPGAARERRGQRSGLRQSPARFCHLCFRRAQGRPLQQGAKALQRAHQASTPASPAPEFTTPSPPPSPPSPHRCHHLLRQQRRPRAPSPAARPIFSPSRCGCDLHARQTLAHVLRTGSRASAARTGRPPPGPASNTADNFPLTTVGTLGPVAPPPPSTIASPTRSPPLRCLPPCPRPSSDGPLRNKNKPPVQRCLAHGT